MSTRDRRWPLAAYWPDVAWVAFSLFSLGVMIVAPEWETIPFHFIWVSLTLLYGFRVWSLGRTWLVLAIVMAATAAPIAVDAVSGSQPVGELAEVPLMTAMFVAMVWHARRRVAALEEVRRVSESNARLLEREQRFLQDASHELRTPITIALGHAELIVQAAADPAVAEDARVVVDEMGRLRALADRLLVLASAEQPSFLSLRAVAPAAMVEAAMRRWAPIPRRWSEVEQTVPTIAADGDRLASALDALIENAVTHTSEGDGIQLRLLREPGSVVIAVADEGTGIAPEHLEHIFGRFARADAGRERNRGGVGLGLNIAKTIAEAHGGGLRVSSTPGEGSVFELVLPVAEVERVAAQAVAEAPAVRAPDAVRST